MSKISQSQDLLQTNSMLETETVIRPENGVDETILTLPGHLEDIFDEESIDIGQLDLRGIERIHGKDPFMYHSIVQHTRKMRSSGFISYLDGIDDNNDWLGPYPADAAAGTPNIVTILGHSAFVDQDHGYTSLASEAQVSNNAQKPVLPVPLQLHLSPSSGQGPSSFSSPHLSPFSQSAYTHAGLVIRKSRLSVEVDCRKEMAELIDSISSHPRCDLGTVFEWDNAPDSDLNDLDLSFLELE